MEDLTHRELQLLASLRDLGGSARNSDLAKVLDVSEETIRRTVRHLGKTGALVQVRGGAYLAGTPSDPSFFSRISQHSEAKRAIAERAADLVQDGMTLFLDVGSTTAYIAEALREKSNLTVATNSIGVAQTLANHQGNRVFLLGGEVVPDERGCFGPVTAHQARRFAYDMAILSADALSRKSGFLYLSPAEAALNEVIATCANQIMLALVSDKFTATAPHRGFPTAQVDYLISDCKPKAKLGAALTDWGVDVQIAAPKG